MLGLTHERSGATTETGAGTAADWIAIETRQVRRDARSDLRLAQAVERHEVLPAAMAEGKVNAAQARAIVALAEQFDGRALEAEEARALRRTTFTMFEDDEGTCHGRFRIPAAQGQMLTKMILAICSPSRSHQRHRRIHDPRFTVNRLPNGKVSFHRRT